MEPEERAGSTPTPPWCGSRPGAVGPGRRERVTQGRVTRGPRCLFWEPPGRAAPSAASLGALPGFQVFGAGSTERDPGEPRWAPPWSRLCLAGGQKQKTAPKGTWKLLSRDGDFPALHWARGEPYSSPTAQCRVKCLSVDPARAPGSLCTPGGASPTGLPGSLPPRLPWWLGSRGVSRRCCLGPARKSTARPSSEGGQGRMALC